MSSSNPAFLTATDAAAAIQAGRLSPVELVDALLARIDAHDERLHAFAAVYHEDARAAAEAAHKAISSGHGIGPWHGVPVALKDIIDIEGRVTTIGSKHWENRVSPTTATLVRRLTRAGMIVIGKANTVEFAMGGWGTNQHMGTPRNPWDSEVHRAPGGSSSGSGVSVAARLVPWAIGTDTGGSVRIPSAWCGLAGLKVTIGQVSAAGVAPLSHTLDTPGPMTRSVEDAAHLYTVLQGPDPADPATRRHVPANPLPTMRRGVAGLRLGIMPEAERRGVDAEVLAAYDASVDVLAQAGAQVETLALPRSAAEYGGDVGRLIGAEGYFHVGALVDDEALPIDEDVRPRIWLGKGVSAADYLAMLRTREDDKRAAAAAMEGFDALLTPATLTPAPAVDAIDQNKTPAHFTRMANWLEWCALVVPNGATAGGLPTSLHIVCRERDEATALRIGWAYEQATEWHLRVPPGIDA
ncbi:MAG: amidase [Rhodospirillales bacterium]|nr:amidase [Rhodospirillales bacterium]